MAEAPNIFNSRNFSPTLPTPVLDTKVLDSVDEEEEDNSSILSSPQALTQRPSTDTPSPEFQLQSNPLTTAVPPSAPTPFSPLQEPVQEEVQEQVDRDKSEDVSSMFEEMFRVEPTPIDTDKREDERSMFEEMFKVEPSPKPEIFSEDEVDKEEQDKTFPVSFKTDSTGQETISPADLKNLDANYENLLGRAIPLPIPYSGSGLYSDLKVNNAFSVSERFEILEKARKRYKLYAEHPDSSRGLNGVLSYKGTAISPPETLGTYITGEVGVGLPQLMYLGATNLFPKRILETGGALASAAIDATTGYNPELEKYAQNFVDVNTADSIFESIVVEGTSIAMGMGGAGYLVSGIARNLKQFPALYRTTQGLGIELGAVAATDPESETLLIGDKRLLTKNFGPSFMAGVQVPGDSPAYEQILRRKTNILMDGLTAGKIIDGTVASAIFMGKIAKEYALGPFTEVASEERIGKTIVENIFNQLNGPLSTKEEIDLARQNIVKLVEQGKDIFAKVPLDEVADVQITTDTMAAVIRALDNNDTEKASILIQRAAGIKRGAMSTPGLEAVGATSAKMSKEKDRVLKDLEKTFGGVETNTEGIGEKFSNVASMRKEFQKQGVDEIDDFDFIYEQRLQDLEKLTNDLEVSLKNDPTIVSDLLRLEDLAGVEIASTATNSIDPIVAKIMKIAEDMDAEKAAKFNAVKGGSVDSARIIDILKEIQDINVLASIKPHVPANSQVSTLLDQIQSTKVVDSSVESNILTGPKLREQTDAEVQKSFEKFLEKNGVDFGFLFTDLRPNLVTSITNLINANKQGAAFPLIKLKNYIDSKGDFVGDGALEHLISKGDAEVATKATEALDYHKEWARYWDYDFNLDNVAENTLARLGNLRRDTIKKGIKEPEFMKGSRTLMSSILTEANRPIATLMISKLGTDADSVLKYIKYALLEGLDSRFTGKRISEVDISTFRELIKRFSGIIEDNFPKELKGLNDLADKATKFQSNKELLQKEIQDSKEAAKEAKERILGKELKDFFVANNVSRPKESGYEIMKSIINDKDEGLGTVKGLVKRSLISPLALEGMRSAYFMYLRELTETATKNVANQSTIPAKMLEDLRNFSNGTTPWEMVGKELFLDKPEMIPMLRTVFKETGLLQRSTFAKALPSESGTANLNKQIARLNTGVTAAFGVLSRPGAILRNLGMQLIKKTGDPFGYQRLTAEILSNPDEFIRLAKEIVKEGPDGEAFINYAPLRTVLIKASIYRDESEESFLDFITPDFMK